VAEPRSAFVELARLSSAREAEELSFTLRAVGIATIVEVVSAEGNGSGAQWSLSVAAAQLAQAQQILTEEREPVPAAPVERPQARAGLYWVVGLALVTTLVWWVMEGQRGGSESVQVLLRFGASHRPHVAQGQWWRLVTAIFLHIGLRHLLANLAALLIFGTAVLRAWGVGRFTLGYVLSGVAGNVLSLALSSTLAVKAGASGAILGLLGILAALRIRSVRVPGRQRLRPWHIVAMVVAFYGFVVGVGPADHLAHVGGLLAGAALGFVTPPLGRLTQRADRLLDVVLSALALVLVAGAALLAYRAQL
jgi:rhomboid protease GluP